MSCPGRAGLSCSRRPSPPWSSAHHKIQDVQYIHLQHLSSFTQGIGKIAEALQIAFQGPCGVPYSVIQPVLLPAVIPGSRHLLGLCNPLAMGLHFCTCTTMLRSGRPTELPELTLHNALRFPRKQTLTEPQRKPCLPISSARHSYWALHKPCQHPICFHLMSLCCSGRWDASRRSLPLNAHSATPCHIPWWANPMQHRDQVRSRTNTITMQWVPFCFLFSFCLCENAKAWPLEELNTCSSLSHTKDVWDLASL